MPIEVVLVDGVGTPRIFEIADADPLLPAVLYETEWTPPHGRKRTIPITAWFERCAGILLDGRPVYRQAATGLPLVRYSYLKRAPIRTLPA